MSITYAAPVAAPADDTTAAFSFTILSGRDAPQTARQVAVTGTGACLGGEARFNLQLLITEVITNAVVHGVAAGTAPIEVEVALIGRCVGVEVTNSGPPFGYTAGLPAETDLGGRGLALVDGLAERWGTRHEDGRTTLWFELDASR